MGADGALKTIQDRNQNILTFTPAGITSSAGNKVVTFTRDDQGRITSILEPKQVGNFQFEYDYNYDATGNLISAFAPTPGGDLPARYTYDDAHRLLKSIDYNGNPARTSTYDGSGRLASDTDAMGNATTYAYDVSGRTTTTTYPDTGVMTQTFDARGSVLSQTDQLGRTTTHVYDANENETKRTNALGEATRYTYDTNGNQTSSTNALGEATTITYNAFSEPLTTTNPIGNTTTIAYDDQGLPTSFTDSMGALATFTSSEHGQPTSVTDAVGNTVYLNYDDSGDFTSRTDRLGRVTSYTYDGIGLKQTMTDPRHGVTQYAYDFGNDLVTTILPLGFGPSEHLDANRNVHQVGVFNNTVFRDTDYDHDAANHLILTTNDDDGSTIHQTVDFRGNVLSVTDEAGHATGYAYDLSGELLRTTNPDGTFTTQSYDALGRLSSKTDERGNTTVYGYEPGCSCTDRLTSVTDPLDRATMTTYDGMGRKTSVTDPAGHQTFYAYDLRGHLIETDYADATSTHDTYDILGRRIASADQSGATTHYGYDAEEQLTSVTDPLGNLTRYAYDPNGNLTSVTDANNHTTTYGYDANNRKISRTLPLGMTETFAFDDNDNIVGHTDFRGKTTTLTFDARRTGRLVQRTPDPSLGEPTVTYALNTNGTRASMADASGATSYTYDPRNRLLVKVTPEGTLTYTYDASGNVQSIKSSNANGTSVGYAWDAANQLVSVTDNRLGGMTTAAYSATGRPANLAGSNGVSATYTYDLLDRVTSLAWNRTSAPAFASWAYTYSPRGQRLTSTEITGREAIYGYDAAARLASETITGDPIGTNRNGALTYSVDPVGNRLSRASTLAAVGAQSFEYDGNDEVTLDGFDVNGNTTSSGGHTFAYDFDNRLVSKDGGAVTVVYDGDGNRVAKTVAGLTTRYLVDELNPTGYLQVLDEVSEGAVRVRYTFGNMLVSETQNVSGIAIPSFYGYDAHGNIAFLSDAAGAVTDTYDYDAWGILVAMTGATRNSRLYSGEEFDSDLGLINLRARQYNASTGRFTSGDSRIGKQEVPITSNRYLFANADPVNAHDPRGLASIAEEVDLSAIIAATEAALLVGSAGVAAGAINHTLGDKDKCAFQEATDVFAAISEEPEVNIYPDCPRYRCFCHVNVDQDPDRDDIPRKVQSNGEGKGKAAANIRCVNEIHKILDWHPANTGPVNVGSLSWSTIYFDRCIPAK
jgi:RHS repeat-associated protein